jgi:hypothetical protein
MNAAASGMTAQAMAATAARRDIIACPLVQAIPVSCFLLRFLRVDATRNSL